MSTRLQTQVKAAPKPSFTPVRSGLLQRKCACGGAAGLSGECEECSKKKRLDLQTKLKVNDPGDIYEREADRMADQVTVTPAGLTVSGTPPRIQRFSGQSNAQMDAEPASVDQALASPGRPLEPTLRQDMEQRFGHDFSRVRVHSGAAAEQSAREVNANAYTVGHDIVFGADRFAPETQEGRRLLAHELTHVVQQSSADGIHTGQSDEKRGLPPTPLHPMLQRDTATVVSLHPEETGIFTGSLPLPSGKGRLFYSVELHNVPPLMLDMRYRDRLESRVEAGIRAILKELGKSDPLPSGLPTLRLRLDAGYSKVMKEGYLETKVRRAARGEMKRLVAQAQKEELERLTAQSQKVKPTPSLRETAPVWAELASEVEATFLPALEGVKEVLPTGAEYPEPVPIEPVTTEEQETPVVHTKPLVSCADLQDPQEMVECMRGQSLRYAGEIRKEAAEAGEKLATVAEALNPADPANLAGAGVIKLGGKVGIPLVVGAIKSGKTALTLSGAAMRRYLQNAFRHNPILNRLVQAQKATGQARHEELIKILADFQRKEGIRIEWVPEGTVQAATKAGNVASLRSKAGVLQIEKQVLQDTDKLMSEVRHELAFHYAGGPGNVPVWEDSPFNALDLLDMAIQEGGEEAIAKLIP